jgi:hypothetical protein
VLPAGHWGKPTLPHTPLPTVRRGC